MRFQESCRTSEVGDVLEPELALISQKAHDYLVPGSPTTRSTLILAAAQRQTKSSPSTDDIEAMTTSYRKNRPNFSDP